MAKFRIGVAGLVHDHIWDVLQDLAKDERAELCAAADPNQPLLDRMRTEYGVTNGYTDYEEMLDKEKLDGILVYADNVTGPAIVEAAAERKVHAMIEKPMASRLEGAERALLAAQRNGTLLAVNWPTAWYPQFAGAVRMAAEGEIGRLFKVRYRAAHQGPRHFGVSPYFSDWLYDHKRNGAGALMDYCCYGAMFSAYLLGRPGSVVGAGGRLVDDQEMVDDNAILLLQYENALGICEASWSQWGFNYELMINGTEGSLKAEFDGLYIFRKGSNGAERVEVGPLPAGERNAADFFLTALEKGSVPDGVCTAKVGRDAQEILEAGLVSVQSGGAVPLPFLIY